ncbi:MAG: hypothetical protein AAGK78_11970, partial [Planctomycetota bacterium]
AAPTCAEFACLWRSVIRRERKRENPTEIGTSPGKRRWLTDVSRAAVHLPPLRRSPRAFDKTARLRAPRPHIETPEARRIPMHNVIYIVGLIVVILAVLSFAGVV